MRMSVLPGSLWVAYVLTQPAKVQRMLPPDLELAPVRLLEGDASGVPRLLFNSYDVSSHWMKGHRCDVQVFARHRITRTPHLVVLECWSNTMLWNPRDGVRFPNAEVHRRRARRDPLDFGLLTMRARGEAPVSFCVQGRMEPQGVSPDRTFVVEANRECFFGTEPEGLKMRFDEDQLLSEVRCLPRGAVKTNTLWSEVRASRPSHVFVHARAMNFDVTIPDTWVKVPS